MRKFLIRMSVYTTFLLLFFPATIALYSLCSSASDFDKLEVNDLVAKFQYLKEQQRDYNTVFIGSSMVYRHFNTGVFDSICHTKSFNLGSGGLRPVRSFAILEMLYTEDINLNYVLFELNRFETLKQNFNTSPSIRALTWKYYSLLVESVLGSDYSLKRKLQYVAIYTYTLAYKYFGTGVLGQIARQRNSVDLSQGNPYLRNQGFYAIDEDVKENQGADDIMRNKFLSAHRSLLDTIARNNTFNRLAGYQPQVLPYSDYMRDLQQRFLKKGTQLVFVINPRNFDKNDVTFLNKVAHYLPAVINLSDSRQYPEFYDYAYSFDMAHFTSAGAERYSKHLANEFNKVRTLPLELAN